MHGTTEGIKRNIRVKKGVKVFSLIKGTNFVTHKEIILIIPKAGMYDKSKRKKLNTLIHIR